MEETVPSVEAYEAAMVLSGVGDALGYRGGRWEYCTSGPQIHEELAELGGLAAITLEPPEWPVSDDTVLHLATAEGLATGLEGEPLLQELARRYVAAMGDMEGRKPGPTSILGYLGALAVALFGALGARGEPPECWGAELLRVLPLAWDYVEGTGVAVEDNAAAWSFFGEAWHRVVPAATNIPSDLSIPMSLQTPPTMAEPRYLQADCRFRPGTHTVRVTLARTVLRVEVEAHGTADLWRSEFDAAFIEDMTRKTGNFKQFGIFCSMLESALMQNSESVSLELLTYTDLETLRSRKVGAIARPPPSSSSPLSTRRYLILVYSVEFDRIHYPLPLPYAGRQDLATLVRELREELAQLRARRLEEIQHLRDALRRTVEEKRVAEARHQREHRQLAAQLAEAKASEQRLQLRVKSLTAELASCRRGRRTSASTAPCPQKQRSASLESHRSSLGRPSLRSPSPAGSRLPRFDPTAFVRARQRRQKEAELRNDRRVTRTERPLSTSSCNGPCMAPRLAASHKLPTRSATGKRPGKENHSEEPSAELAEIDARLWALQEYMNSLDTCM
ncbi:Coiled-coil domain-containing protein 61 [Pitangus sulphuratus]|nr:Coiled-coil domain-containing protein 61 [Pitangus sulphuratus]